MASRQCRGRPARRRMLMRTAAPLVALGVATGLLATGGSSATATSASAPAYTALAPTAPRELPIVAGDRPGAPSATPEFPEQPPEGAVEWPQASTIRRLTLSVPGLTAW